MSLTTLEEKLEQLSNQLSQFINADATTLVTTDAGAIRSLAGIQEELFRTRGLVPCVSYDLLSELPAGEAINTVSRVINDADNNGLYIKKVAGWVRYGWEDIQYFTPTIINQNESKSYLNTSELTNGKSVIVQEMSPNITKNKMYVFDIKMYAWQNQSNNPTPSAAVKEYRLVVMNRGLGEYQYTLTPVNTTSVSTLIDLNLQVTLSNNNLMNMVTVKAIATGQLTNVYGLVDVKRTMLDSQQ